MKISKRVLTLVMILAAAVLIFPASVHADTNGSEIQITDQPGQLILQLGPQWAGMKFQLRTDAGVFPVPVVVDADGVLRMEIGGSETYTLSCIAAGVTIPGPDDAAPPAPPSESPDSADEGSEQEQKNDGVPIGILILFLAGLAAAVGGLFALRHFKRSHDSYDYYDEDNEKEDFDDEFND